MELPKYNNPPVVETALSVQFEPIPGFSSAHMGLFWGTIRTDFPNVEEQHVLPPFNEPSREELRGGFRLPQIQFETATPGVRLQLISEDRHRMIQLQNGRLVYNWLRREDGTYPTWRAVRPGFEAALSSLLEFVGAESLQTVRPNQWEVVYVNHIFRDEAWTTSEQWHAVLPALIGPAASVIAGELESINCNWSFGLPGQPGRLHINLQHALEHRAAVRELLLLKLVARGPVTDGLKGIMNDLDVGHGAIVTAFDKLASGETHALWGRDR